MATGEDGRNERAVTRQTLHHAIRSQTDTLTIMTGDFNYVVADRDRFCKETGSWSGRRDQIEEAEFTEKIADPFGLYELEQGHMTQENARARSRIDRVYLNQHIADQLDGHYGCAALPWVGNLSAHRPLSFFRRRPRKRGLPNAPLATGPINDPSWPTRVALHCAELRKEDARNDQPLRRLFLLKRAIQEVTDKMHHEIQATAAETKDDQLGWTMRFLRAAEEVRIGSMLKCAAAYPHLKELADPRDPNARCAGRLNRIRDHAVELARSAAMDELQSLHAEQGLSDEMQTQSRRESLQIRLKRLTPGRSTCLRAMCDTENGNVTTEPQEMAKILQKHWGQVFSHREVNTALLQQWLEEVFPDGGAGRSTAGLPEQSSHLWRVRREDVAEAIANTKNTMPGPDRIPYMAWKALGDLGIDTLFEAASALQEPGATEFLRGCSGEVETDEHEFNLAILCCLPKKPTGTDPEIGQYFAAEATRPLAIVNTDNRLIASAFRIRWEPALEPWVSHMQRGFLKGRSMIANIVDIDYEAMRVSLKCEEGTIVLFDFQAAFPSISHEYLNTVLRHIGFPPSALSLVAALYDQNRCRISCQGARFTGFEIRAGIRQGCPLSPLLFAVVVDLLLRRLKAHLPDAVIRAFADDTAAVLKDLWGSAQLIKQIFDEFADISGLRLNMPKTFIIPLWPERLSDITHRFRTDFPQWQDVAIATWSTYLGIATGPGKGDNSWAKAATKFSERAAFWSEQKLGLQYAAASYNAYAVSVLSFLSQVESPPDEVIQLERKALELVAKGPRDWALPNDLWQLKECYGQTRSFRSVSVQALAAQARVYRYESISNDGLEIEARSKQLQHDLQTGNYLGRRRVWQDWYKRSHILLLASVPARLATLGISGDAVADKLAGSAKKPWAPNVIAKVRKTYQKHVAIEILRSQRPCPELRMRHKLERWHLPGPPAHVARRVLDRLGRLQSLAPPRVCAAYLGTLWNKWTTARRYQQRESIANRCRLGCAPNGSDTCERFAEDSLEHYASCAVTRDVAWICLRIDLRSGIGSTSQALETFLMTGKMATIEDPDSRLLRGAILVYASFMTFNLARAHGGLTPQQAREAMMQYTVSGVRGHTRATRELDCCWARDCRPGAQFSQQRLSMQ